MQGRQAQFLQERELEFATKTNLDAVRTLLESNAESLEDAMRRRRMDSPLLTDEYLDARLQALEKRYKDKPDVLAQLRADDRLVRRWHTQNVTASYTESVLMSPPEPLAAHQRRVASIQAQVDKELALNLPEPSQDFSGVRAESWAPYQKMLNTARQANFDTCYTSLVDTVNAVFRKRIVSVVNWLSAPLLLAALDDFHCEAQRAGLFYQSAVGMAMHGINSCPAGAAKIDGWWKAYSAKNRENLLWRHVAANNPQLISELEPYLATVKAKKMKT